MKIFITCRSFINRNYTALSVLAAIMLCFGRPVLAQKTSAKPIPCIQKRGVANQLIVDGKPFLILGGELRNSNTSSLAYLKLLLPKLVAMQMNTVLAPVTWDLIEPQEGKFDFSLVDGLLKQAREIKLRVVVLWFGSWKNGMSTYTPDWVKTDQARFPRVKLSNDKSIETCSVFGDKTLKADSRAFTALMKHIKAVDEKERTVIMIQVENEVGIHGDSRDRSALANAAFEQPVPQELMSSLQKYKADLHPAVKQPWEKNGSKMQGAWEDVFGKSAITNQIFMAWYYSTYVNQVAAAGKAVYNLPMYVNVWLPPNHPSGGPVAEMHDIWRAGAAQIDLFSPDIYKANFKEVVAPYYHTWKPLFIPECVADSAGASNAYYAIGRYSAIGFSPFAVEDRITSPFVSAPVPKAYKILSGMAPVILDAQSRGIITGVTVDEKNPVETISMGGYNLEVHARSGSFRSSAATSAYGLIINSAPNEFIISGLNLQIIFSPSDGSKTSGFLSVWEGDYKNGQWIPGRKLNGDETTLSYSMLKQSSANRTGTIARIQNYVPGTIKVKLYQFN